MADDTKPDANDGIEWNNAKIVGPLVEQADTGEAAEPACDISGDALLNIFVSLAEKGVGQGITLYVRGLVLTGIMISRKSYFEQSREFLGEANNALSVVFDELLQVLEPEKDDGGPSPDYRFVHLRNGQVITPGQGAMPNGGTLMRILRDDVTGWSLGNWKTSAA